MPGTMLVSPGMRDRFRRGVEPVARGFGRVGLTPNALTLIGFGIALVAAWAAATQSWTLAGVLVIFGGVFDLLDGALARATGTTSRLGAFLDSTFDRLGEAVVYIGVIWGLLEVGYVLGPQVAAAAMAAAFMVSYTRAKSENLGFTSGTGMAAVGVAPREVRIVILTVGLLAAGLLPGPVESAGQAGAAFFPLSWTALVASLALIAILATITTFQRIVHVMRQADHQEHP
jgi:phosphatidylglycerophosphate synthase